MAITFIPNKYQAGEIVYAKVDPERKLFIKQYMDQIYYCGIVDEPYAKELVYFERELVEQDASVKNTEVQ